MVDIIEMFIDEQNEESGWDMVSIVENPAIESGYIALNKHQKLEKAEVKLAEVDRERQILMGPLLIPGKLIFRRDDKGNEFYIHFSKDTCRKGMELFMKRGHHNNTNEEHTGELKGNTVIEVWQKEDMKHDKSALFGLEDPVGTIMITMKIGDKQKYQEYKNSKTGFSLEGYFVTQDELQSSEEKALKEILRMTEFVTEG